MDAGLDDEWEDATFLDEIFRKQDEAVASRNPNHYSAATDELPPPPPTSSSSTSSSSATAAPDTHDSAATAAPVTHDSAATATPIAYLPAASASVSYLPAAAAAAASASASVSYLPAGWAAAASYHSPSPALRFSPPRELTQRPPLPPPPAGASDGEAQAMVARGFTPPRELSQHPAAEESDRVIVGWSGPAAGDRFMGTGSSVGRKRDREAREVERLKKELNRVSRQMNDLKNECTELRKDRTKKDIQIKAIEAEIQNLKKANAVRRFRGSSGAGVGGRSGGACYCRPGGARSPRSF